MTTATLHSSPRIHDVSHEAIPDGERYRTIILRWRNESNDYRETRFTGLGAQETHELISRSAAISDRAQQLALTALIVGRTK